MRETFYVTHADGSVFIDASGQSTTEEREIAELTAQRIGGRVHFLETLWESGEVAHTV